MQRNYPQEDVRAICDLLRVRLANGWGWWSLGPHDMRTLASLADECGRSGVWLDMFHLVTLVLGEVVSAAWAMWARLLRSERLDMPFDLTFQVEQEIVVNVFKKLASLAQPSRAFAFPAPGWDDNVRVPAVEHSDEEQTASKKSSAGRRDAFARELGTHHRIMLVGAILEEVGQRVLSRIELPAVVSRDEVLVMDVRGRRLQTLVTGKADVEAGVRRWETWVKLARLSTFLIAAPWPFPPGELQLLVGHPGVPDRVKRHILDQSFLDVLQSGSPWFVHAVSAEHRRETLDVCLACILSWDGAKRLFDNAAVDDQRERAGLALDALYAAFREFRVPRPRFVNLFFTPSSEHRRWDLEDSKTGPGKPEPSAMAIRESGRPFPRVDQLPSAKVLEMVKQVLATRASSSARPALRLAVPEGLDDEMYRKYVEGPGLETAIVNYDDVWFLDDAARFAGVCEATVLRRIRERAVREPLRFKSGRQKASYPVFTKPEVFSLWIRCSSNEEFAALLGLPVRQYRRTMELLRTRFRSIDDFEARTLLLRFRGRWPSEADAEQSGGGCVHG